MPEFKLFIHEPVRTDWGDLDAFTQGYIEALFFTETASGWTKFEVFNDPDGWEEAQREGTADGQIPGDAAFHDLSAEALGKIVRDCRVFQQINQELLERAYRQSDSEGAYDATRAGRDFWYTRNGHGVGFWDRQALEVNGLGDALTEACRSEGPYVYAGEVYMHWTDAKVYAE